MNRRMSTLILATALVAGLTAGPAAPAVALSGPPGSPSATAAAHRPVPESDAKALSALLATVPDDATIAALVRVGGRDGVWHGSVGHRDLVSKAPADPEGRFRAGSVTKVFTAAVVLQLAAERRISLDAPVRRYLPDLVPAAYGTVTVRQLLNHTHGIPTADHPGTNPEEWYAQRLHTYDPRDMARSALAKEPSFGPGDRQVYGNIGYTLAGLLIERVTRDTWERQLARRVTRPLGLDDTYAPGTDPRIRWPHNVGYQAFPRPDGTVELRAVSVWSQTESWAAGDLISTTRDLERFTQALFRGEVVRGPLLEEMFTVATVRTGLASFAAGLQSFDLNGREVWGKSGGRWGYNTAIAATRDLSRTVVYSLNSTDAKGQDGNPLLLRLAAASFPAAAAGGPAAPAV